MQSLVVEDDRKEPKRGLKILIAIVLIVLSMSGAAYQLRPIAGLSIDGPRTWHFQAHVVDPSSYGLLMPITVKLQNDGNTGIELRVVVEGDIADISWKKGEIYSLSSSETSYVGAHSEKGLTFFVSSPRNDSITVAVRIEVVQNYSSIGATMTTMVGFFGETTKLGPTTLEYKTWDGTTWSLVWAD